MNVQHFFDKDTFTLTYIVYDHHSKDAVIIDPVLDYDPASGAIENHSLRLLLDFINQHQLKPIYSLETHAHADHLSSSQELKKYFPKIQIAVSENITKVQNTFKDVFQFSDDFIPNGSQFDKLIKNGETFHAGTITIHAIPTPGHTPACLSFHIKNMIFCGDALFIEDSGTGRCDFPHGSAEELFISVHERLYSLPDDTIVFVGHDYQPNGRELRFETTIGKSKKENTQLRWETTKEEYVKFREARDKTLSAPRLLFASIQVNINAGKLPTVLKMPLFDRTKKY